MSLAPVVRINVYRIIDGRLLPLPSETGWTNLPTSPKTFFFIVSTLCPGVASCRNLIFCDISGIGESARLFWLGIALKFPFWAGPGMVPGRPFANVFLSLEEAIAPKLTLVVTPAGALFVL